MLVEAEPLGDPDRDQALAQDVLHRLAEPEIDAQRERADEFREPDLRPLLAPPAVWIRAPFHGLSRMMIARGAGRTREGSVKILMSCSDTPATCNDPVALVACVAGTS